MADKKHIQYGLGGLRSETAGGWSNSEHYLLREPGSYTAPASMTAPASVPKEPTAEPKTKRRKTTTKDKAVKAANAKDLKQRNIK